MTILMNRALANLACNSTPLAHSFDPLLGSAALSTVAPTVPEALARLLLHSESI